MSCESVRGATPMDLTVRSLLLSEEEAVAVAEFFNFFVLRGEEAVVVVPVVPVVLLSPVMET